MRFGFVIMRYYRPVRRWCKVYRYSLNVCSLKSGRLISEFFFQACASRSLVIYKIKAPAGNNLLLFLGVSGVGFSAVVCCCDCCHSQSTLEAGHIFVSLPKRFSLVVRYQTYISAPPNMSTPLNTSAIKPRLGPSKAAGHPYTRSTTNPKLSLEAGKSAQRTRN